MQVCRQGAGAIQVNILIMRAFTRLRQMLSTHEELKRKIEAMERKYDRQFRVVFDACALPCLSCYSP